MTFVEAVTSRWRAALVGAVALPVVLTVLPIWYVESVGSRCVTGYFASVWSAAADFRSWTQVEMFLTDGWNNVLFVGSVWLGAALGLGISHWWALVTDPSTKPEPAPPPPPPVAFRIAILALVLLGGCCLLARGADDEFAKEYARADGTWVVTAMEMDGDDVPAAGFKGMQIVLKGTSVTAKNGTDTIAEGSYKIVGVAGKVVSFDLTIAAGADKGKSFPAVNEWVDADTIRTVLAQPGQPRPAGGATPVKGDRRAVFVISRKKP